MKFKDLFQKYTIGTVSPEELETVEEEISKFEILSDYVYDKIEGELEGADISAAPSENTNQKATDFERLVRKQIRNAFWKAGTCTVTIVLALVLFVQFGLSPLMKSLYYDPTVKIGESAKIDLDMAIFTELRMPLAKRDSVQITDRGYGKYDMTIQQNYWKQARPTHVGGEINRGEMHLYDPNFFNAVPAINTFAAYDNFDKTQWGWIAENMPATLAALEENQYYRAQVSFGRYMSFSEMMDFQKENALDYLWYAIRTNNGAYFANGHLGMMNSLNGTVFNSWDAQRYPELFFHQPFGRENNVAAAPPDEIGTETPSNDLQSYSTYAWKETDETAMTTRFLSLLQYMMDNPEFASMMRDSPHEFADAHAYVQENGLEFYGLVVEATKEELLRLSTAEGVVGIYVMK